MCQEWEAKVDEWNPERINHCILPAKDPVDRVTNQS